MKNNDVTRRKFIQASGQMMMAGALVAMPFLPLMAGEARQVVLITGTSSGFGWLMALTFARAGYKTYATMRNISSENRESAEKLRHISRQENLSLEVLELDVTQTEQAEKVVQQVINREGRIDVLINNAGAFAFTPMEIIPRDLWDFQMKTNVYAPMELVGLVKPFMRAQKSGLIIQLSSRVGSFVIPGISLYATSKFAIEAASEAAHYEATPEGIDFAIIQPGPYDTDINRNARRIYSQVTLPLLLKERPQGEAYYRYYLKQLDSNFSGQPTRNPQEVADLALKIARTPRADRVLRYPIGDSWEIDPLKDRNSKIAGLQKKALLDAGYDHLYRT